MGLCLYVFTFIHTYATSLHSLQTMKRVTSECGYTVFSHSMTVSLCFHRIQIYTYHIGLVALSGEEGRLKKDVIVQLCNSPNKPKYLSMNVFLSCLRSDPDMDAMEKDDLPLVIQTLFICSGSDYTSYFCKYGKSTFLSTFFQFAEFITGPQSVGTLRNASVNSEDNLLAFYRLIGCI